MCVCVSVCAQVQAQPCTLQRHTNWHVVPSFSPCDTCLYHFSWQLVDGHAKHRQSQQRLAPHCVHIADGIGSSYAAKVPGIVNCVRYQAACSTQLALDFQRCNID